jgi:hypothetical protein
MQLIGMVAEEKKARLIWDARCPKIDPTWLPTAKNIDALPKPLYDYVAGLETNADPPSMVADNIIMRDTIRTLEMLLKEKPAVDDEFVEKWADKFDAIAQKGLIIDIDLLKQMLAKAGVEVIKV